MRVGILGSGLMGGKLGTIFARAGHEVIFSYARGKGKLEKLARDAQGNARTGTPGEAVKEADAVLLAVHWSRIDDVLNQAGDLSGKVIVTCSLPMDAGNTRLVVAHTSSGEEELAKRPKGPRSFQPSIPCPAKCCSECSTPGANPRDPAWCIAAMIKTPNAWPPS